MNRVDKRGFTLIELMLAMSFVAVLLIAIAMTVMQIGAIYNRGLTIKDTNQAGRSLASELKRSIANNTPFNISTGAGSRYIKQNWGGRLCTGEYSYIWNYGKDIKVGNNAALNLYLNSNNILQFVKVLDQGASYCTTPARKIDKNNAVELLNVGEHDLSIHSFTISTENTANDSKTNQRLYNIDFVIGTNDQNALTTDPTTGDIMCKAPNQIGSDPSYCAVNQFSITTRAGNSI